MSRYRSRPRCRCYPLLLLSTDIARPSLSTDHPEPALWPSVFAILEVMAAKDDLGRRGEAIAAEHLTKRGLQVIEKNWRCPQGEIDIVARDGSELVFVEVKTRSSEAFGHPLEAITDRKLARLRRLAAAWCASHPGPAAKVRIDAIAVLASRDGRVEVDHVERVF